MVTWCFGERMSGHERQKRNQQQLHCHRQQGFTLRLFTRNPLRRTSRPQTPEVRQPACLSSISVSQVHTSHNQSPTAPTRPETPTVTQTWRRPRASHTDRGPLSFPPVVPRPVRTVHHVPDSKRRKHLNLLAAVAVAGEEGREGGVGVWIKEQECSTRFCLDQAPDYNMAAHLFE